MLAILFALAAALPHSADLYVSGFFDSSVQRFAGPRSAAPGAAGGTFAKPVARRPWGLAFGPDGALWVANEQGSPAIVRVSGPFSATPGVVEPIVDDGRFLHPPSAPPRVGTAANRPPRSLSAPACSRSISPSVPTATSTSARPTTAARPARSAAATAAAAPSSMSLFQPLQADRGGWRLLRAPGRLPHRSCHSHPKAKPSASS